MDASERDPRNRQPFIAIWKNFSISRRVCLVIAIFALLVFSIEVINFSNLQQSSWEDERPSKPLSSPISAPPLEEPISLSRSPRSSCVQNFDKLLTQKWSKKHSAIPCRSSTTLESGHRLDYLDKSILVDPKTASSQFIKVTISLGNKAPAIQFTVMNHSNNEWIRDTPVEQTIVQLFISLLDRCSESDLVLDMGTSEGLFSMLAAHKGCSVATLDPQTLCTRRFITALNHPDNAPWAHRVTALNVAAAATASVIDTSPDTCIGCYKADGSDACTGEALDSDKMTVKIDAVRLSHLAQAMNFPTVWLWHADIEGFEQFAVQGVRDWIEHRRIKNIIMELKPEMWMEGEHDAFRGTLRNAGYTCWYINHQVTKNATLAHIDLETVQFKLSDIFCSLIFDHNPQATRVSEIFASPSALKTLPNIDFLKITLKEK